jgi:hypothetical protein
VIATFAFLILAIIILHKALRMLRELFHPEEERRGRVKGCVNVIGYLVGLFLWFSAGMVALVVSIQGFAERLILALQ